MSTKMNTAAYMEKYGWKPGMGLGKDNTGMAEHIRVSKKNDKRGIGMDGAQTFEPWWEKLYNKTAQQSMSKAGQDKQKQPGKEGQPKSVQPMKSTGQLRVLGARLAPMFVKGNTLEVDEKKQEYKVESSSSSSSSSSSDSDDESRRPISTSKDTFEALGGRTGKKYSAAGKLSRLQAQEKKWALIRSNSVSPAIPQPSNSTSPAPTESPEPSKKKKKKKEGEEEKDVIKKDMEKKDDEKEKKRKRKKEENEEDEKEEEGDEEGMNEPEKKKKKKHHHHKKHHKNVETNESEEATEEKKGE